MHLIRLTVLCFVLLSLVKSPLRAQVIPAGKIHIYGAVLDSTVDDVIEGARIQVLNSQAVIIIPASGLFDFYLDWGARIQVSAQGYLSRFITFNSQPLSALSIALRREANTMRPVVVTRKRVGYAADSTARQATYARVLARQHEGGVMSPVSFIAERLSRKSRRMFQFQKDFAAGEEQRYIDSRYTPQLTAAQTNLSGDSLACFMNTYPMPEDVARTSSDLEIKQWVRWNYKKWVAAGRPMPQIITDSTSRR